MEGLWEGDWGAGGERGFGKGGGGGGEGEVGGGGEGEGGGVEECFCGCGSEECAEEGMLVPRAALPPPPSRLSWMVWVGYRKIVWVR